MKLLRAVIEDNEDPLKLGRLRVRIFGLHTKNNENSSEAFNTIKSTDLPWAECMGGTEFGLIGGIGISSVLQQGTWVWCILENDNVNKPIILGTINGTTKKRDKYSAGEGFNDKDDINPFDARLDESDLNRLARNEKLLDPSYDKAVGIYASTDTIHKQINDNVDTQTGITDNISGADVSMTEPNSLNDASIYPHVKIIETSSGHVIEIDDTPKNERIRLYHTTGSYMEIRPDGTFVQKSVNVDAASHYIHMSDVQEHVAKGVKRYIEGDLEEIINLSVKRHIKATLDEHIDGNMTLTVGGDVVLDVTGAVTATIGGDVTLDVTGAATSTIGGDVSQTISGNVTEVINGGTKDITVTKMKLTGDLDVTGSILASAEIKDKGLSMSGMRSTFDAHVHVGNLGAPVVVTTTLMGA